MSFASIFTTEYTRELFVFFSGRKADTISEIEVSKEEVLEQSDNLKSQMSPVLDVIHGRVSKDLKFEVAELLKKYAISLKTTAILEH